MALRQQNSNWNPWGQVAILLLLAIAAIGTGAYYGARAQPAATILDLLKKKASSKAKPAEVGKKGLTPGKGLPGSKGLVRGTPAAPKNATSKASVTNPKSVLGKKTETPGTNGLTKAGTPKGPATSAF